MELEWIKLGKIGSKSGIRQAKNVTKRMKLSNNSQEMFKVWQNICLKTVKKRFRYGLKS